MKGLGLGFVANHFDVVPVRTNDESCIVVRVVVLHLIKMWLECSVEETDDRGRKTRTTEAKDSGRGIPQGSPLAPRTQKQTLSA
jgi:hypothetical protein